MSEEHDLLLEALLAETLGGETPPDLTERICRRAFAAPPWANPWFLGAGVVAAAALVAVIVSLSLQEKVKAPQQVVHPSPPSVPDPRNQAPYPTPTATGSFDVADGGAVRRGATLISKADGATLTLGGYGQVQMEAQSTVRIEGAEKEEAILLQDGSVTCEVERKHGSFTVRTPFGKVAVTGTKFQVQMRKGDEPMTRSMYIKVLAGTVLVASAWGETRLAAGEALEQPNQGRLTGIVTAKTEKNITVRVDQSNEVKQFMPNWIGGLPKDGGGLEKKMLLAIRETPVGSHVVVEWKMNEHLRVLGLKVLERPAEALRDGARRPDAAPRESDRRPDTPTRDGARVRETGPRDGDKKPEGGVRDVERKEDNTPVEGPGEGVLVGSVTGKGENWIEVKGEHQEKAARYTPRWHGGLPKDGGGLDRHMLETFRMLKVGERIRLTWMDEERLRAIKIERLDGDR